MPPTWKEVSTTVPRQDQQWFRMSGPIWESFLAIVKAQGMDKSTGLRYAVQEYVMNHNDLLPRDKKGRVKTT